MDVGKNVFISHYALISLIALLSMLASGCTTGPMNIESVHYYAVPDLLDQGEGNMNYYRLKVKVNTKLGRSGFQQGWYPADAVDSLFGVVDSESSREDLKTKRDLQKQIRDAEEKAMEDWIAAVNDDATSDENLAELNRRRQLLRAHPLFSAPILDNTTTMEYNTTSGLVVKHLDEKLVFVLSSDPNEVVAKIKNFAESTETALTIDRLVSTINPEAREYTFKRELIMDELAVKQGQFAERKKQVSRFAENLNSSYDNVKKSASTAASAAGAVAPAAGGMSTEYTQAIREANDEISTLLIRLEVLQSTLENTSNDPA